MPVITDFPDPATWLFFFAALQCCQAAQLVPGGASPAGASTSAMKLLWPQLLTVACKNVPWEAARNMELSVLSKWTRAGTPITQQGAEASRETRPSKIPCPECFVFSGASPLRGPSLSWCGWDRQFSSKHPQPYKELMSFSGDVSHTMTHRLSSADTQVLHCWGKMLVKHINVRPLL